MAALSLVITEAHTGPISCLWLCFYSIFLIFISGKCHGMSKSVGKNVGVSLYVESLHSTLYIHLFRSLQWLIGIAC